MPSRAQPIPLPASKRQIDLAGQLVRQWWETWPARQEFDDRERQAAFLVLDYRAGFQEPLNKVTMGVRSFVTTEGAPIVVSQRLKRLPTIVGKLARYPNMQLTRMQDIGGCRAILPDRLLVAGVARRIRKNWGGPLRRYDDYIANPKPTGYRAIHAVVVRQERLIEVQLRTPWQQEWAATVDRTAGHLGVQLKDGEGPPELLRYFRLLADGLALMEEGQPADEIRRELGPLREKVRQYFE